MSKRSSVVARACASICVAMVLAAGLRLHAQDRAEIDRDVQELRQYRLTMVKVKQMAAATIAYAQEIRRNPLAKQKADEAAARSGDDTEPKTLGDMVRRIEREPGLAKAIRDAGLTTREYSILTLSFFQTMFAHGMKKAGTIKEMPPDILPENIAFVQANEAELNQIFAQLQSYEDQR